MDGVYGHTPPIRGESRYLVGGGMASPCAERLRGVEAAGTTLTAHKMGRYRTGQS